MRLTKSTFIILLSVFIILAASEFAFGQNATGKPEIITTKNSGNGELTSLAIDMMLIEVQKSKERLFVVVRLGTGEKLRRINQGRLIRAQNHLAYRKFDLTPVYAEGERVKGEGRVEFYVGSRLYLVVLAERNKIPPFTCC